jgi:hypothetical protein
MKHFNANYFGGEDHMELHYTVNTYGVQQNYLLLVKKQHICNACQSIEGKDIYHKGGK